MREQVSFQKAFLEEPDDTGRLVFADWLEEHDEEALAGWYRQPHPPLEFDLFRDCGDGSVFGYGDGDDQGYGGGLYYHDSGAGFDCGSDEGHGHGFGIGHGDGHGEGHFASDQFEAPPLTTPPLVGRNELIVLPYNWVVCGHVAEQIGPFQYRVEDASVICRTGGTPWDRLAGGRGREHAVFRKWGTITIGPTFVLVLEWLGELP